MRFPSLVDQICLHERVLQGDPVAPVDVFQAFMGPLLKVLNGERAGMTDEAYDSAVDAVFSYLREPARYDRSRALLSTYLTVIARKRMVDRCRKSSSRTRRDDAFASIVELTAASPNEEMERSAEVRLILKRLEEHIPAPRDREALRLVLWSERATERFAEV
ncbi:RNA polymerase sigma factor, partial [Archangium sp.]|uniref:RNA polymerase sigma factor n=1 Tax=Archangium sp. TaxID=1872627 RepID=UPI00389AC76C